MQCREIMRIIEEVYPQKAALDFDNVGLLVGRVDKDVHRIYLALDATDEVIQDAIEKKADMIITHHPLIFSPVKKITNENFLTKRILTLIQHDIAYYAMHTNYDVLGMSYLAGNYFELKNSEILMPTMELGEKKAGIGIVGELSSEMSLQDCCHLVKEKLNLNTVRVFGDFHATVHRFAISPGSGKSCISPAIAKGADVLVTGDIGHHEGIDAVAQGIAIIDAGHYGTEHIFIDDMEQFFQLRTPKIQIFTAEKIHPFQVC